MEHNQVLRVVRAISVALASIPALLISGLLFVEVATQPGPSANYIFHVSLAVILLAMFGAFAATILRSRRVGAALLLGAGGFVGILTSAVAGEIFGPLFVLPMAIVLVVWTAMLVGRPSRRRSAAGETL